ncbi:MAG: hypothetical protein OHK0029_27600 [Armatimonadaceae bacterium]
MTEQQVKIALQRYGDHLKEVRQGDLHEVRVFWNKQFLNCYLYEGRVIRVEYGTT